MRQVKTLSVLESQRLGELIEKYCKKVDNGFAAYASGWCDGRIVEEHKKMFPDSPINNDHVNYRRKELVGVLFKKLKRVDDDLDKTLEARIAQLEAWAIDLDPNFKK